MKKHLQLLFLFFSLQLLGQHPDLLDRTWYVQSVTIDGQQYDVPNPPFDGQLYFWETQIGVAHNYCEEGFDAAIISYEGTDQFTFEDGGVVLIGVCGNQDLIDFMQKHYELFWVDNYFAHSPCTYTISEDTNGLNLVVTNDAGDIGVYGDYQLGIDNFRQINVSICPNPAEDILTIQNPNHLTIESIVLYDTSGKIVIEGEGTGTTFDVSAIPSGVYFLRLETEQGVVIKRVVKI